jgi:hypothetical protein
MALGNVIRFRKRVQIDADNNLYARDPQDSTQFIIVGNIEGIEEITEGVPLDETIRYRKAIRIDENDDLYIIVDGDFVNIGNSNGVDEGGGEEGEE